MTLIVILIFLSPIHLDKSQYLEDNIFSDLILKIEKEFFKFNEKNQSHNSNGNQNFVNNEEYSELRENSRYCDGICYFKRGEISVIFRENVQKDLAIAIIEQLGYSVNADLWQIHAFTVKTPIDTEKQVIEIFRKEKFVKMVDYNYISKAVLR